MRVIPKNRRHTLYSLNISDSALQLKGGEGKGVSMYLNTESKTAKSTQRKLSRIVHTDFTVVVGRHLFHF